MVVERRGRPEQELTQTHISTEKAPREVAQHLHLEQLTLETETAKIWAELEYLIPHAASTP